MSLPIMLDVLVSAGAGQQSDGVATDISELARPSAVRLERVRRWFADRGLPLPATDFGLSGTVSEDVVARVLDVDPTELRPQESLPVPPELSELVDQITIPIPLGLT